MEYYIYDIPVFVLSETEPSVDVGAFCEEVEEILPQHLLHGVDVVYLGEFKELRGRNAAFSNGAIYMVASEPTTFDALENFIHEAAHALEIQYGPQIYTNNLQQEFVGKRQRLRHLLAGEGYQIDPRLYAYT